jgi:drug/metabolite transporter (DMT)-like permease
VLIGPALALTLASSLSWAGFDVVRKLAVQRMDARALLVWMSVGQLPLLAVWAALGAPMAVDSGYLWPGIGAVALNAAASLLYLESVRIAPLSTTIPLLGLTPALSTLAGAVMVGELPRERSALGIALVVAGAFSLNARASDLSRPWRILGSVGRERGSALMACVAVLWSVSPVVDKLALRHASVVVHAFAQVAGVALVMAAVLAARGELGRLRDAAQHRPLLAAAIVVGVLALVTQLQALRLVLVSVFEAIKRAIGMSLSVLSGRVLFGEPITLVKLGAVGAMTAGVALLTGAQ